MLAPSAIYRKICKDLPKDMSYKIWISEEKKLHKGLIESGKIPVDTDFAHYLNKKLEIKSNKANSFGSLLTEAEVVLNKAADILEDKNKDNAEVAAKINEPKEKFILGLRPAAFYSLSAVVVLGFIAGAVVVYKKTKKK